MFVGNIRVENDCLSQHKCMGSTSHSELLLIRTPLLILGEGSVRILLDNAVARINYIFSPVALNILKCEHFPISLSKPDKFI